MTFREYADQNQKTMPEVLAAAQSGDGFASQLLFESQFSHQPRVDTRTPDDLGLLPVGAS